MFQEAISTSTLNVARANSYQSLNSEVSAEQTSFPHQPITSFSHQPIIRHPGDNKRSSSDNIRHPGDNIRHHGDSIRHPDNIHHTGDNVRYPTDNTREPIDKVGSDGFRYYSDAPEENNHKNIQPNYQRERPTSEEEFKSSFISRGIPSMYEATEQHSHSRSYSADRSSGTDLHNNDLDSSSGGPGSGGSSLRRRYQPSNHGHLGIVRRVNNDKSEETQRRRGDHNGRGGPDSCDSNLRYTDVRQPRPPQREVRG